MEKKAPVVAHKNTTSKSKNIRLPALQEIIDSSKVKGAILIYNPQNNHYYSNDFDWATTGQLPASTFKIIHSIIALETNIVIDEDTLFEWDGVERDFKIWEQDLNFRDAFRFSCVPCYQDIARKIGVERMNFYVDTLNYAEMHIDTNTIDNFWLEGASRINQFQQIDFLKRFYQSKLPIHKRTAEIVKKIMLIQEKNTYKMSGKTGWSITNDTHNGWFVGYLEKANEVYFFATNIAPKGIVNESAFVAARKNVTITALEKLKIID